MTSTPDPDDDSEIGGKVKVSLADMDLPSWEHELKRDLEVIEALLAEMHKITPEDDAKLQHLKARSTASSHRPSIRATRRF